jgi:hypothetical protein
MSKYAERMQDVLYILDVEKELIQWMLDNPQHVLDDTNLVLSAMIAMSKD